MGVAVPLVTPLLLLWMFPLLFGSRCSDRKLSPRGSGDVRPTT
jgi:hypothetical protein